MGKSSPPPPPAPPNYAEATREGIYTDIETLPTRRLIEQAARMGEVATYTDPDSGERKTADFTGFGDIDLTQKETAALIDMVPQLSEAQLSNLLEYGPQFIAEQRSQLRQTDPEGFDLREEFARKLRSGRGTAEELVGEGVDIPEYLEVGSAPEYMEVGSAPEYMEAGDRPDLADVGITAAGRSELEERIFDRLALGEKLSPDQQRALEQDVLRAGARRGQALSGGTALREVLAKFGGGEELGRQRRAEALGLLGSGQATSDVSNRLAQANFANALQQAEQANRARGGEFTSRLQQAEQANRARSGAFTNIMQQIQQANQARGATFAGQQQNLGQQLAARQQNVGNIQSLLGLQPIAAQGGYLAGLSQGASPFTMPQMQRGSGLDPNAGATASGFAGNVFGTQGDIWSQQAQLAAQPSGFGQLAGGVLGAFGGGFGEALGKNWGKG